MKLILDSHILLAISLGRLSSLSPMIAKAKASSWISYPGRCFRLLSCIGFSEKWGPLFGPMLYRRTDTLTFASVASLWEIGIKFRLGKLDPGMPVESLSAFYEALGIVVLPITATHALTTLDVVPPTRDPFDRILLAQCQVEGCRLVTVDRALRDHPLAARFGDAPTATTEENPKTPH